MSNELKTAKCYYENGEIIITDVSGKLTDEEIKDYFIGMYSNLYSNENDKLVKCINVEIIE